MRHAGQEWAVARDWKQQHLNWEKLKRKDDKVYSVSKFWSRQEKIKCLINWQNKKSGFYNEYKENNRAYDHKNVNINLQMWSRDKNITPL